MNPRLSDAEFESHLRAYLDATDEDAIPEFFYTESGKVNREKTLALPCFSGMTDAKKESLL